MQAKVKKEFRFGNSLQAFGRFEFAKNEWRDVPAGLEAQAQAHEWLEVRERPIVEAGAIETVSPPALVPTAEKVLSEMLSDMNIDEPPVEKKQRSGRRN